MFCQARVAEFLQKKMYFDNESARSRWSELMIQCFSALQLAGATESREGARPGRP
jgi:hypothetical protein